MGELRDAIAREIREEAASKAVAVASVAGCIAPPVVIGYLIDNDTGIVFGLLAGLVLAATLGVWFALRLKRRRT